MPDPRLKTYAPQAVRHLAAAGGALAARQDLSGPARGNIAPWPGETEPDFHGTLSAIWVWARHRGLSKTARFDEPRALAWSFVLARASHWIPDRIDGAASDEAAYDCALVLWAAAAERALGPLEARRQAAADRAARVLAMHLGELESLGGREFRDPAFLALALLEYARAAGDRGLAASGRKFVERAFGMKAPPPFATEPAGSGLFDFSSTTATRVLAVMAAEGNTPFRGRLVARAGGRRGARRVRSAAARRALLERLRGLGARASLRRVDGTIVPGGVHGDHGRARSSRHRS